jgi:hypothetical protein
MRCEYYTAPPGAHGKKTFPIYFPVLTYDPVRENKKGNVLLRKLCSSAAGSQTRSAKRCSKMRCEYYPASPGAHGKKRFPFIFPY